MIALEECGYKLEIDMGSRKLYKHKERCWRIVICSNGRYKKIDDNGNPAYINLEEHKAIHKMIIKLGFYNGGTE